jgi:hypothetical protein
MPGMPHCVSCSGKIKYVAPMKVTYLVSRLVGDLPKTLVSSTVTQEKWTDWASDSTPTVADLYVD